MGHKELSERTLHALTYLRQNGVKLCMATGRGYLSAPRLSTSKNAILIMPATSVRLTGYIPSAVLLSSFPSFHKSALPKCCITDTCRDPSGYFYTGYYEIHPLRADRAITTGGSPYLCSPNSARILGMSFFSALRIFISISLLYSTNPVLLLLPVL